MSPSVDGSRLGVTTYSALVVSVAAVALAGVLVTGGCSQEPTTVISRPSDEERISALERGELRRDALEVARAGMAAFDAADHDEMAQYFGDDFVATDAERFAAYAREGRDRHRDHEVTYADVMEMSADGTTVTVSVRTIDHSYFVEADGSQTQSSDEEVRFELRLTMQDGGTYLITNVIAGRAALE
jgi:hypothetical protein